jgi:hypothetical protein
VNIHNINSRSVTILLLLTDRKLAMEQCMLAQGRLAFVKSIDQSTFDIILDNFTRFDTKGVKVDC